MPKFSLTRRQLLVVAAPIVASIPLVKLGLGSASAQELTPLDEDLDPHDHTHAAMIGAEVPAPGGPRDLDELLYPPPARPYEPGRVREYEFVAVDREIEIAPGVFFPAWTYNGTVPGPIIRATEDDLLRVKFTNEGSHPHTIHFHGIHPADMDGVFEIVDVGESFHVRVPRASVGQPPLPLPLDAVEEAHPQGAARGLHHRSARAAPASAGTGHGDERLRHGR